VLAQKDLVKGKTIGIDATTLEANAALRSIVRRDSGETYQEFLSGSPKRRGSRRRRRAELAALIGGGQKKVRNKEWRHRTIPMRASPR